MHHLAIMNKKWGLITKILSGEKSIESRFYKHRITPWHNISPSDTVYFKDSACPVTAKAKVKKVLFFENFNRSSFNEIIEKYADDICLSSRDYSPYYASKNYCILVFLEKARPIKPFSINKKGYGVSCAWITLPDINKIKLSL